MEFKDKKVLVCGLGLSGIASAKLLYGLGARVAVCDNKAEDKIQGLGELEKLENVEMFLGKNPDDIVIDFDCLVISPGIATDLPFVRSAIENDIPVLGEIELAYSLCPCPVVGITGTNGKTTTTSLCGEILKRYNPETRIVGNIGVSFAETIKELKPESLAVAEISSFQLETAKSFKPSVAAVLNVTPDHLNRHKSFENYASIKGSIFKNQSNNDFAVLNFDDDVCRDMAKDIKSKIVFFSRKSKLEEGVFVDGGFIRVKLLGIDEKLIDIDELIIPGAHNVENALAAIAITLCAGAPTEIIKRGVLEFEGVEHRTEFVCEINGISFYNDSKATNPDAAIKGIEAMSRPIVLIGGGCDKNSDFTDWIKAFDDRVKHLIVIGEVADKIIETCAAYNFTSCDRVNSMRDAVELSFAKAEENDCVLLSPACASYDMFDNYEQRGRLFKEFVFGLR